MSEKLEFNIVSIDNCYERVYSKSLDKHLYKFQNFCPSYPDLPSFIVLKNPLESLDESEKYENRFDHMSIGLMFGGHSNTFFNSLYGTFGFFVKPMYIRKPDPNDPDKPGDKELVGYYLSDVIMLSSIIDKKFNTFKTKINTGDVTGLTFLTPDQSQFLFGIMRNQ